MVLFFFGPGKSDPRDTGHQEPSRSCRRPKSCRCWKIGKISPLVAPKRRQGDGGKNHGAFWSWEIPWEIFEIPMEEKIWRFRAGKIMENIWGRGGNIWEIPWNYGSDHRSFTGRCSIDTSMVSTSIKKEIDVIATSISISIRPLSIPLC